MPKNTVTTKILAVAGTVLLWLPILFMIITSIFGTIMASRFRLDFLIPAELFPIELIGALLVLWAAQRAHLYRKPAIWGLVSSIALLIGSQAFAVVSGLASGKIEPKGWLWAVVVALLILFLLSIIEIGIVGLLLVKKLYRSAP